VLRLHVALKVERLQDAGWVFHHHRAENGAVLAEVIEYVKKPSFST